MGNWPGCHQYADYDHYLNFCKKIKNIKNNSSRQQTRFKIFQTATALKHRNAKLKLYIRISTVHFKILKKKTCIHIGCQRNRDSWASAAIQREIHSERAIGVRGEQRCRHRWTRGVDDAN